MSIILRNILTKFKKYPGQVSNFCSVVNTIDNVHEAKVKINIPTAPIISTINYHDEDQMYQQKRQVWIDSLDTIEEKKLGLMTLHPAVFADKPRLDTLYENVRWQRMFRFVNYAHVKNRAERRGGGRKPWPQKGGGRARHGSINSPLFKNAGRAHGPRSPTVHFYMLPFFSRVNGLTAALSVKLAQDDLYVVNSLEIPSKDPKYIESLMEERNWGPSLLLVDTEDIMPENITIATDELKHVNLMPAYGLNVYSMLKHSTLVLTERAVRHIESRILYQLYRPDTKALLAKFKLSQV